MTKEGSKARNLTSILPGKKTNRVITSAPINSNQRVYLKDSHSNK